MFSQHRSAMLISTAFAALMLVGRASAADQTYQFDIPAESLSRALTDFSRVTSQQIIFSEEIVKDHKAVSLRGTYSAQRALDLLLSGTGLRAEVDTAGVLMIKKVEKTSSLTETETIVITGSRLAVTGAFDAPTPVAIVNAEEIKFTGTVNLEKLLGEAPQFMPATNGSQTSNTVQANGDSGAAYINLRGLGQQRNLVLVNGRRFTTQSTSFVTDINTIPAALVERTEIVTGGSSAVYGSDAISGVVNFVMKKNFQGVEGQAQYKFDEFTVSPIYTADLTVGGNFDHDKGNVVMSIDYTSRKGFTWAQHGHWTAIQYTDACVTAASYSPTVAGSRLYANGTAVGTGAACIAAGGKNGFVNNGSSDVSEGYIKGFTAYSTANTTLKSLYDAAGITGVTTDGIIFSGDTSPNTYRLRNSLTDLYNQTTDNYYQIPQQRWMANAFGHYDFNHHVQGYAEFHFSSNIVSAQLVPSSVNGTVLIQTHNPCFSSGLQSVLDYMDVHESGTTSVAAGTSTFTTSPGDGVVAVSYGKRLIGNGDRRQDANRIAFRFAGGFKGEIGSLGEQFFKDLDYDAYYTYTRTQETDRQSGSISKSKLQAAVLASSNGGTPVCDLFGSGDLSKDCVAAITVSSQVMTNTEMQGAQVSVSGTLMDFPAGPAQFVLGGEWRYSKAEYIPDTYTRSGDVAGLTASASTSGYEVVHEGFSELRIPVLADLPFADRVTLNAAMRYSGYNLAKAHGVLTWSSGIDWKISSDLTLRGQYQRAIRAPNVSELYGGLTSNAAKGMIDPCGSLAPTTQRTDAVKAVCLAQGVSSSDLWTTAIQGSADLVRYTTGGNDKLAPEKADTTTLGVVITPDVISGLAISIDYYSIAVHRAIASLGGSAQGVLTNCYYPASGTASLSNPYCQAVIRSSAGTLNGDGYVATAYGNIGGLVTRGVDLSGQYSFDTGYGLLSDNGRFTIGTTWNHLLAYTGTPSITDPSTRNQCAGTYGTTACAGEPLPYFKGNTRITWQDGPFSISLKYRYIGGVELDKLRKATLGVDPANYTKPYLPDMHYFDLSANYDVNDNLTVYGGISNLFSKDPPILASAANYANSSTATYDVFGRVTFIGVTARTN
jgi:outer membrane receptor protein involved in Fe transport